jgi:molecular chaperone DnaK
MMSSSKFRYWVLSIDFGTTATAGAMSVDDDEEVIEIDNAPRMPSMVCWKEGTNGTPGRLLLGEEAENEAILAPQCLERCPKRKLGQEFMLLGSERVRVTDAIAEIFMHVLGEARPRQGGHGPAELRLTHPARWGERRLAKLVQAAGAAGFDEPRLVPEPVGAAVYFASAQLRPGDHVAVYDLGGGTFDTAVLRRTSKGFDVVGQTGGRDDLGGEDFDDRLYRLLGARLDPEQWQTLISPDSEQVWQRANYDFRKDVRRAKERLSKQPDATVRTPIPGAPDMRVSVSEFEQLISDDIERTVDELERTIEQAGQRPVELSAIYLAGGSSRIPLVARRIEDRLGKTPSVFGDPKSVIALGATRAIIHMNGGHASRAAAGEEDAGAAVHEEAGAAAGAADSTPPLAGDPQKQQGPPPSPKRAVSQTKTGALAGVSQLAGGIAVVGAILLIASRFMHWAVDVSAWQASFLPTRYSVLLTVLSVLAGGLVVGGLARNRGWMISLATGIGAFLTGAAFPLILPNYHHLKAGFWLGILGGVLIVVGGLLLAYSPGSAQASSRWSTSRHGRLAAGVTAVAMIVVVGSMFLHIDASGSAWSAPGAPTHYPLLTTLIAVAVIALLGLELRNPKLSVLVPAAVLSCFLLGQVFPLIASRYTGLKVGFWLAVVGALIAVVASLGAVAGGSLPRSRASAVTGSPGE